MLLLACADPDPAYDLRRPWLESPPGPLEWVELGGVARRAVRVRPGGFRAPLGPLEPGSVVTHVARTGPGDPTRLVLRDSGRTLATCSLSRRRRDRGLWQRCRLRIREAHDRSELVLRAGPGGERLVASPLLERRRPRLPPVFVVVLDTARWDHLTRSELDPHAPYTGKPEHLEAVASHPARERLVVRGLAVP